MKKGWEKTKPQVVAPPAGAWIETCMGRGVWINL